MSGQAGIMVFARMSSRRLPGKALCDFGGMPLLAWMLRRARSLPFPVFLATSVDPADTQLVELANAEGVESFRGPLDDVLGRAAAAAHAFGLHALARLCADRPYFDTEEMARALRLKDEHPDVDLVSNYLPVRPARGLTTEVISVRALDHASAVASTPEDREHLSRWFYRNAGEVRILHLDSRAGRIDGGFAIDTRDDLARLLPRPGWGPTVALNDVLRDLAARTA